MFNIYRGFRGSKGRAMFFSLILVSVVFITLMGTAYSKYEAGVELEPRSVYVLSMRGYSLESVYFEVHSNEPVDVCITDASGLDALYSGGNPLCYYRAQGVKELKELWRFPSTGEFYLLVISGERRTRLTVLLRSGPIVW